MFSYRHAFHAGNHADVLKHTALLACLRHLMRKPAPLLMADTHAGAGLYRLDEAAAQTSGEAAQGVLRLQHWQRQGGQPCPALADYLALLDRFNAATPGGWRTYPGSPLIMHALMDEGDRAGVHDRLKLFELHTTDIRALHAHVAQLGAGRRVAVAHQDGFDAPKALLPPPQAAGGSRRALLLVDPSYEAKTDYARTAATIADALSRFATGVYLVWYPVIARPEAHALPRRLRTLAQQARRGWLDATLHIGAPARTAAGERTGLTASGMFVVNPPHTLHDSLAQALPQVLHALQDDRRHGAHWHIESGEGH